MKNTTKETMMKKRAPALRLSPIPDSDMTWNKCINLQFLSFRTKEVMSFALLVIWICISHDPSVVSMVDTNHADLLCLNCFNHLAARSSTPTQTCPLLVAWEKDLHPLIGTWPSWVPYREMHIQWEYKGAYCSLPNKDWILTETFSNFLNYSKRK